jgi:hypothetical protein
MLIGLNISAEIKIRIDSYVGRGLQFQIDLNSNRESLAAHRSSMSAFYAESGHWPGFDTPGRSMAVTVSMLPNWRMLLQCLLFSVTVARRALLANHRDRVSSVSSSAAI